MRPDSADVRLRVREEGDRRDETPCSKYDKQPAPDGIFDFGRSEWERAGIKVSREDIRHPVDARLFASHEIGSCLCFFDYSLF